MSKSYLGPTERVADVDKDGHEKVFIPFPGIRVILDKSATYTQCPGKEKYLRYCPVGLPHRVADPGLLLTEIISQHYRDAYVTSNRLGY